MTNTDTGIRSLLEARIAEAVEWSNWYFEAQDWRLSEYWHLHAVELMSMRDRVQRGPLSQH